MEDVIPHSRLAGELFTRYGQRGPGYHCTYKMIASGLIPAEYRGGRIFVKRADVPEIARILGIDPARHAA